MKTISSSLKCKAALYTLATSYVSTKKPITLKFQYIIQMRIFVEE